MRKLPMAVLIYFIGLFTLPLLFKKTYRDWFLAKFNKYWSATKRFNA